MLSTIFPCVKTGVLLQLCTTHTFMDPETNIQGISSKSKKSIVVAIFVLIVLTLGVFYAQKMGWFDLSLKQQGPSTLDKITKFQELAKQKNYDACITEAQSQIQNEPGNVLAWQWQGICQFESGKYTDAKTSFEKILTLDPNNQPAKTYLKIMGPNPDQTMTKTLSLQDFETQTGLGFSSSDLNFDRGLTVPPSTSQVKNLVTTFKSILSAKQANDYLVKYLKAQSYNVQTTVAQGYYKINASKGKTKISINVLEKQPVQISILYEVLK